MDKAIVFSINNDYAFALANALMSLKDNSEHIYNTSDFIIYHDGINDKNQQLLKTICNNIHFIDFTKDSKLPEEIYTHPHMNRWGKFIYQKLNCFSLTSKYEHVLWLDADILVNGDISEIFDSNADMAWRSIFAWKLKDIYNHNNNIKKDFPCCHAGVIYFNKSIANKVSYADILDAYNRVKEGKRGGIDERIMTYIAFSKKFNVKILPIEYNSWLAYGNIDESKIIHFLDGIVEPKPWKNSAVYAAFPEWGYYYKKWIKMGGNGPLASKDKFYCRRYTFGILKNAPIFIQIIKNLDIIKNAYIYTNFDFSKTFCQFYIHNIPQNIHYEILNSGDIFKVCLHIENKQLISNATIALFEEMYQDINNVIRETSLYKENFLKLEISTSEELINFTMNILVNKTLTKILQHFLNK